MFRQTRYHPPTWSAEAPGEHVIVFDGDCGYCRASVEFIRRHADVNVVLIPFSEVNQGELLNSIRHQQLLASAHYITPDGKEFHGGESMIRAFGLLRGGRALSVFNLWGLSYIRELGYTLVASNRPFFSMLTRLLAKVP